MFALRKPLVSHKGESKDVTVRLLTHPCCINVDNLQLWHFIRAIIDSEKETDKEEKNENEKKQKFKEERSQKETTIATYKFRHPQGTENIKKSEDGKNQQIKSFFFFSQRHTQTRKEELQYLRN